MIHPSAHLFSLAMDFPEFVCCNEGPQWTCPGGTGIGTEIETIQLLFGLVRTLKPQLVVETGCDIGSATRALGLAVMANGSGRVVSCDVNADSLAAATKLCTGLPVTFHLASGDALPELSQADFAFIDSSYASRCRELARLKPSAIAVVHDTTLERDLHQAVERSGLAHFFLPGPRGFAIVRRD